MTTDTTDHDTSNSTDDLTTYVLYHNHGDTFVSLDDYTPSNHSEITEKYRLEARQRSMIGLGAVYEVWNGNYDPFNPPESEPDVRFHKGRAMSVGDIIVTTDGVHIVRPVGFDELDIDRDALLNKYSTPQ